MYLKALRNKTPYKMVHSSKPKLNNSYEWGTEVYIKIQQMEKLEARAKSARWIGHVNSSNGHQIYWPDTHKVSVKRNIIFPTQDKPKYAPIIPSDENKPSYMRQKLLEADTSQIPLLQSPTDSHRSADNSEMELKETSKYEDLQPAQKQLAQPRRSKRLCQNTKQWAYIEEIPKSLFREVLEHNFCSVAFEIDEDKLPVHSKYYSVQNPGEVNNIIENTAQASNLRTDNENNSKEIGEEPTRNKSFTDDEAMKSPDSDEWVKAMEFKLNALNKMHVWDKVEPPVNTNIIGSKWVYCYKCNLSGLLIKRRALLVAQGFTQIFGVDYDKTFSLTIHLSSLWLICALAARNDWLIHQMNVDSAYLNAYLDEPIYLKQPPGYNKGNNMLLLRKALYSLKQLGRHWHKCLSDALFCIGFTRCNSDPAVFYSQENNGLAIIAIAVDDLTITATDKKLLKNTKNNIKGQFNMKDLNKIYWLLDIKIDRDRNVKTISLSQDAYI
jgi:hypothetical protein